MGHILSLLGYYATRPDKWGELRLLQFAKATNFEQARAAQNQLIRNNEGFLRDTVANWIGKNSHVDFGTVLQDARVAFLAAIEQYDLGKDVSIRSYARYHLLEVRRQTFKKSAEVELPEDFIGGSYILNNPDFQNFNLLPIVEQAINAVLSDSEAEIITLHFFKGMRKRAIANQRGVSATWISAIIKAALLKLKSYLADLGIKPGFLELN